MRAAVAAGVIAVAALGVARYASHDSVVDHAVQFLLVAPGAQKVSVVGDFNGWDPLHAGFQAVSNQDGIWTVTAMLPRGHHRYSFVVDDSVWTPDPIAPRVVAADSEVLSSAIVVGDR
jgi:1,4-alpha-glucan branching enzyme